MTELIFVDLGVKVNCQYYGNVLLYQQMLPATKRAMFVFHKTALWHIALATHHPAAAAGYTGLHRS